MHFIDGKAVTKYALCILCSLEVAAYFIDSVKLAFIETMWWLFDICIDYQWHQ